jgi:hypothetical protein
MKPSLSIEKLAESLSIYDGSIATIIVSFEKKAVASAYDLIQSMAGRFLGSASYCYWSIEQQKDIAIIFGTNPALDFENGICECFHVNFTGVTSPSGIKVPDLGVHVLGDDEIEIDIRLGDKWTSGSVVGLFEIVKSLMALSCNTSLRFDVISEGLEEQSFLSAFKSFAQLT